jgi:polyhydroxybutyrate depolymerase
VGLRIRPVTKRTNAGLYIHYPVEFQWQEQTIEAIRKLNGCDAEGRPRDKYCTLYLAKTGTPVVAYIRPGGHALPASAPPIIVKLFKDYSRW